MNWSLDIIYTVLEAALKKAPRPALNQYLHDHMLGAEDVDTIKEIKYQFSLNIIPLLKQLQNVKVGESEWAESLLILKRSIQALIV